MSSLLNENDLSMVKYDISYLFASSEWSTNRKISSIDHIKNNAICLKPNSH